ncbi:MAG: deoxyribodipyrimidine photo-lyase [Mycobacteriales bacterium]
MRPSLLWLRRDLRLADQPALAAACADGRPVLAVFVLDDRLRRPSGAPRLAFLYRSLRSLDDSIGGRLVVHTGAPEEVVPALAQEVDAEVVHVSADFGPYGSNRDDRVAAALAADGRRLERTGSPYAVSPGRLTRADGSPYRVYSPYSRAWLAHGWRPPLAAPPAVRWLDGVPGDGIPADPDLGDTVLPAAGEAAALATWRTFRDERLTAYAGGRDRPDIAGTSTLSVYLKYGAIHPRTLLADLGQAESDGASRFRGELAWREFYADVLLHRPELARHSLLPKMAGLRVDEGPATEARFTAWAQGRTGYPIVDAGMRQLRAEAWMHNRVRMIVASFLVKDLHLDWTRGARLFMSLLRDGDLASNSGGWQWVAGTGTDPAPFFRVFNPILQAHKFDPAGDYVRRYVPELRGIAGGAVHEPWALPGGPPAGYPARIVDHAAERKDALARFAELR